MIVEEFINDPNLTDKPNLNALYLLVKRYHMEKIRNNLLNSSGLFLTAASATVYYFTDLNLVLFLFASFCSLTLCFNIYNWVLNDDFKKRKVIFELSRKLLSNIDNLFVSDGVLIDIE